MDILQFKSGADWQIIETCRKGDGSVLDLTDCTMQIAIYDGANVSFITDGTAPTPANGQAIYSVSPTQQTNEGIVGAAVYFFATKVVDADGKISFQNDGLLFVASDPWPA